MDILQILKILAAVSTIVIGLVSLLRPKSVEGFTGLHAPGPRGVTEIRAIMGAFFVGLGLMPLILQVPETYQMLGYTYLLVGLVRAVSMFVDHSVEQSNTISVISEVILGVILVL